jgi:hypothetical protein
MTEIARWGGDKERGKFANHKNTQVMRLLGNDAGGWRLGRGLEKIFKSRLDLAVHVRKN